MYLTSEKKEELFSQYGKSNKDTGSVESQVALFSYRIAFDRAFKEKPQRFRYSKIFD